ncbi:MAG: RNA-directed DNA polymerase, partial [Flavobacteriaceae bacterium]|nr:RNA-directed DNA polymerase [Flavobacteriaceae bacterium]
GNDCPEDEMGTSFFNPIIITPKGNIIKLVIDARFLNSITDLSTYSWPLEPLNMLLNRIHGKYFSSTDMSSAYHQVPLSEDAQKLVSFVIGDKQYKYVRGFYGLSGLPNFFSRLMITHFREIIEKNEALAYIDDLLLMSFTKEQMFTLIDKFHELLRISGLKASPEKTEFFLRKVKFLGHIVSEEGTSPVAKKVEELKNLKPPENKRDVMRILGCLNFYSKYIRNLHVRSKIFCELIKNET